MVVCICISALRNSWTRWGIYSCHSWYLMHRLSGRSDFLGNLSRQLSQTLIFPEILHRVNGEGGVYTEAEGLQSFVMVRLVTASVHNHHTAVHKIWITLNTAGTINYNWQWAAGSTFDVHHGKRNFEEDSSKDMQRTPSHSRTPHHTHTLHMQFIVHMHTCWWSQDVATPRFPSRSKKSWVAGCLRSVHCRSYFLRR